MQGQLARPVWGWGSGETPGPTPLFAGSVAGGERSAGFITLASSALRNDLDVWEYVKDVLDRLLAGATDFEPLLPWNWAADHPGAIRQYRVTERHERAEKKQVKRADRRRNALSRKKALAGKRRAT